MSLFWTANIAIVRQHKPNVAIRPASPNIARLRALSLVPSLLCSPLRFTSSLFSLISAMKASKGLQLAIVVLQIVCIWQMISSMSLLFSIANSPWLRGTSQIFAMVGFSNDPNRAFSLIGTLLLTGRWHIVVNAAFAPYQLSSPPSDL